MKACRQCCNTGSELSFFVKFFVILYSLFVGGRDTDYTTEGVAVTLIECALRAQARRAEAQVPTVCSIVDLSLPVVAFATSVVEITIVVIVVPSAEEGERTFL